MNKQIQVLYTIFELELAPPFELIRNPEKLVNFWVHNRHSTRVGRYNNELNEFMPTLILNKSILERVKRTFNADKLTYDNVYHITKHLVIWLQDKFPEKINSVTTWNDDELMNVHFSIDYK